MDAHDTTAPFDWSMTYQVDVQLDELSNVLVLLLGLLQCEQTPLVIAINILYLLHRLLLLHSTEQTADMRCGVRREGWTGDATNHVVSTLLNLLCLQRGEELIYSLGVELEKPGTGVRENIANWKVLIAPRLRAGYLVDRGEFPVWFVSVLLEQHGVELLIPTEVRGWRTIGDSPWGSPVHGTTLSLPWYQSVLAGTGSFG